ncbi:hypothetical protein [Vibrio kanaloae]|uniref:hypothetical protein n=1 Tax=Vibrio kanaloae TaxID=170673 RepID=UPI0014826FA4|nr:hypothetical protein [Vibrio kanaloae]
MDSIIIAAVTGGISSVATIAAIKVDIGWIKSIQVELKAKVDGLELRTLELEKKACGE